MSFFEELKRRNVFRVAIAYGVTAWFILQLADVVLENIAAPEWAMQLIMLILLAGFPMAVIFAWAFEMTPEGIKKEKDVDRSQSITSITRRKLDRAIIVVLAVSVAYLLLDKLILQDSEPEPVQAVQKQQEQIEPAQDSGPSVAVLPFVNMSGDKENEYFSDGLTETLLHMLAQLPELRVAARTSSFAFKEKPGAGIEEISQALGVAHILEGSVQKAGNRVRITAQLIRAEDGFHVWSQNYDRTLEDIFAIQDEIAKDVAGVLDATLLKNDLEIPHIATSNLDAYDTYLRAMEQQAIGSYSSLSAAEGLFKQALAFDPGFIDAKLSLALNYYMQFNTGLIEEVQMQQGVSPLLEQVREEQPDNRLARAIEIIVENHQWSMIDQESMRSLAQELRLLLPLLPSETYIRGQVAMIFAFAIDQPEIALELLDAGLMIDPLSSELYARRSNVYSRMEQHEKARESILKAMELDPRNPNHYSRMSDNAARRGDITGVFEWRLKNIQVDPQDHEIAGQMAREFYDWGLPEEGDRWMARVRVLAPNSDILQRLLIDRAHSHKNADELIAVAEKMIATPATMRHDVFPTALFSYRTYMGVAGRQKEAFDYLVGLRPELSSYENLPDDFQGVLMQWASIELMTAFLSPEEWRPKWEAFAQNLRQNGSWWFEDSLPQALDSLLTGDLDKAVEKVLEELSKPLSTWPTRADKFAAPLWAPVSSSAKVAARLSELKREKEQVRQQLIEMLKGPEWIQ